MTLPQPLLDRLAAAAVAEGLADAVYTRLKTPIGTLTIVQGERGVVRVGFEDDPVDRVLAEVAAGLGPRIVASDAELAATRETLEAYFESGDERLDAGRDLGEQRVEGVLLEAHAEDAAGALDDRERADRRLQARVDGIGEPLGHGRGGDAVEQVLGEGHAAAPWERRVRMAVETRWRAAWGEMPRTCATPA